MFYYKLLQVITIRMLFFYNPITCLPVEGITAAIREESLHDFEKLINAFFKHRSERQNLFSVSHGVLNATNRINDNIIFKDDDEPSSLITRLSDKTNNSNNYGFMPNYNSNSNTNYNQEIMHTDKNYNNQEDNNKIIFDKTSDISMLQTETATDCRYQSTDEYESTTIENDLNDRVGVPAPVVATLLG